MFFPTWKINYPEMSKAFLEAVKIIAMLEFIPSDWLTDPISDWLGFPKCDGQDESQCDEALTEAIEDEQQQSKVSESNRRLSRRDLAANAGDEEEEDGYGEEADFTKLKGPNLIKSIGVFFAVAALILLIIALILCFRACSMTKYQCFKCYMTIKNKVFYNLFIRFALQSFLKFLIAALTTLTAVDMSQKDGLEQGLPAVLILALLLSLPFTFVCVLKKNFGSLQYPSKRERIGSIYMGLRTDKISALAYSIVFFIRRLLFAFLTFAIFNYPHLQI